MVCWQCPFAWARGIPDSEPERSRRIKCQPISKAKASRRSRVFSYSWIKMGYRRPEIKKNRLESHKKERIAAHEQGQTVAQTVAATKKRARPFRTRLLYSTKTNQP